jgi:hypothetical protein
MQLCTFYKPEREEAVRCGTYAFLKRNLSRGELDEAMAALAEREAAPEQRALDRSIREMVCATCSFLDEGCDYRQGLDSPPCGGYEVLAHLLSTWGN